MRYVLRISDSEFSVDGDGIATSFSDEKGEAGTLCASLCEASGIVLATSAFTHPYHVPVRCEQTQTLTGATS